MWLIFLLVYVVNLDLQDLRIHVKSLLHEYLFTLLNKDLADSNNILKRHIGWNGRC